MHRVEEEIARIIKEIGYKEVEDLFAKLSGGKRLRAKLILKIAPLHPKAPLLAAVVELIHAASLLHDDVIDEAMLRRGTPSVNATEGSKIAVMLGDILYSKAFSELVEFDKEIAKVVSNSVTALSKGEMMDVKMAQTFNSDETNYLDMLYLKTATLIEAAAAASAMLAQKDVASHALFGKNLGLSFQIIDDILDITSDETTLGKPAMNDYVEGKCTLPYIYLYHSLDAAAQERLLLSHAKKITSQEALWIKAQLIEHKSIERSFELALRLSNEAKEAVKEYPELVAILDAMIQRSY
ncbi:MAG: polyprenyl synthetase family protein [Epsilonproteobacteria bacterium]|nr:polyprenyl synthetase family protein [Campylobacterota bacterium]